MIEVIKAYNGEEIIVDSKDYDFLNKYKWYIVEGYAKTSIKIDGKWKQISIHRLITNANDNDIIDHRDGDTLNNRRENLRIATVSQNAMNKKKTDKKCTSSYKGVRRKNDYWESYIYIDGKQNYLGAFTNECASANCYNYHANIHFKEFARLNSVEYMNKEEWEKHRITKDKSSKFFGVAYNKKNNNWVAYIRYNGKRIHLGSFQTQIDGAKAYNVKAIELYGEDYKKLNRLDERCE